MNQLKDPEIIRLEKKINTLEGVIQSQGAVIASLQNVVKALGDKITTVERRLRTEISGIRSSK